MPSWMAEEVGGVQTDCQMLYLDTEGECLSCPGRALQHKEIPVRQELGLGEDANT